MCRCAHSAVGVDDGKKEKSKKSIKSYPPNKKKILLRVDFKSNENGGMNSPFEFSTESLSVRAVLWIGFPGKLLTLTPCPGCDFPEIYFGSSAPHIWFLSLNFERTSVDAIKSRLTALVGPFDAIVLSNEFLDRYSFAIRSLKTALLKLCHGSSVVLVESEWMGKIEGVKAEGTEAENTETDPAEAVEHPSGDQPLVAKVLAEISRIIALSLPGFAVGKIVSRRPSASIQTALAQDSRGDVEDRLRMRWQSLPKTQNQNPAHADDPKRIAILGAGIAGVTLALELLERGHHVDLFETNTELLSQGSRQPLLATYPQFAKDANSLSLLTQYSLRLLDHSPYSTLLRAPGRFQAARSSVEALEQEALVAQLGLDPRELQFLNPTRAQPIWNRFDQAAGLCDTETARANKRGWGGLWIRQGAHLQVDALRNHVIHLANQHPQCLKLHLGQRVDLTSLTQQFQTAVVATGQGTPALLAAFPTYADILQTSSWKVYSGNSFSMSSLDTIGSCENVNEHELSGHTASSELAILGGAVSLQSLGDSRWLMGSSYFDASLIAPTEEAQWQFLIEGARALTGDALRSFKKLAAHPGPRCSVRDRMPLIGPLPKLSAHPAQLYLATALGSRGLLWAHLAAQLIADHIDSISPRIGLKALKSIDPLRYAERSRNAQFDSTKISSWPS